MSKTIEDRIHAALGNGNCGPHDLAELVREAEAELQNAEQTAETERARALDLNTVDPRQAQDAANAAQLRHDRLLQVIPKLQDRLAEAITAERYAKWFAEYRRVEEEHDALGQEFADVYRGLSVQLADL